MRIAGAVPGALLTVALLALAAASVRAHRRWLPWTGERAAPRERIVYATPAPAPLTNVRIPEARVGRAIGAPSPAGAFSPPTAAPARPGAVAPPAGAPSVSPPRAGADSGGGAAAAPRVRVAGPRMPVPAGAARPAPAPLDRRQLDSALLTIRAEMAARRAPVGAATDDAAGKRLDGIAAGDLSADGRRAITRAMIVDAQRRDAEAQVQEKGRRPALTLSRRLSFGGPRKPAVSDAEVRAMFERNASRVRRRADSLAWLAESTRIARDRASRDVAARDSAVRGAPPVEGAG